MMTDLLLKLTIWLSVLIQTLQYEVLEEEEEEVEPTVNSPTWTVFPSAVIAGLGVIFNLISLSYFIRREYDSLG
jgi:hypothetical protein